MSARLFGTWFLVLGDSKQSFLSVLTILELLFESLLRLLELLESLLLLLWRWSPKEEKFSRVKGRKGYGYGGSGLSSWPCGKIVAMIG